jgi:hypothetical protein
MLEDLVIGLTSTASIDVRGSRLLLERRSVLANISPPHIVQSAASETVDTLAVVGPDDNVGDRGAILEDKLMRVTYAVSEVPLKIQRSERCERHLTLFSCKQPSVRSHERDS